MGRTRYGKFGLPYVPSTAYSVKVAARLGTVRYFVFFVFCGYLNETPATSTSMISAAAPALSMTSFQSNVICFLLLNKVACLKELFME